MKNPRTTKSKKQLEMAKQNTEREKEKKNLQQQQQKIIKNRRIQRENIYHKMNMFCSEDA